MAEYDEILIELTEDMKEDLDTTLQKVRFLFPSQLTTEEAIDLIYNKDKQ